MTFDRALEILVQLAGDHGGNGAGIFVHFLPGLAGGHRPFELSITALTDIEIALVTSAKAPVAERAEGLRAVGRFLTAVTTDETNIRYEEQPLLDLVEALKPLKGRVD